MTLKNMAVDYLVGNGFDGLFNDGAGECACEIADLMPCDEPGPWCTAGYRAPCDCGEHDWHMQAEKPEVVHGSGPTGEVTATDVLAKLKEVEQ